MKDISTKCKLTAVILGLALVLSYSPAWSHCQVPCGIYDDAARVARMIEDCDTVIKAVRSLAQLQGKADVQSENQRVRWIMNKEKHAQNIIETISNYFLTQRVKPGQEDYMSRLKKHHTVILAAMKAKQSASEKAAIELKSAVETLKGYYPQHVD